MQRLDVATLATATYRNFTTVPPPTAERRSVQWLAISVGQDPGLTITDSGGRSHRSVIQRVDNPQLHTHHSLEDHSLVPSALVPILAKVTKFCGFHNHSINTCGEQTQLIQVSSDHGLEMLHSAAPSSFNMFPFSQPPQHPGPAPPSHHGDMFHPPPSSHHHTQHHQQTEVVSRPKFLFKMPRVVPNQKEKFETDEFMKRHSREGEVRDKV